MEQRVQPQQQPQDQQRLGREVAAFYSSLVQAEGGQWAGDAAPAALAANAAAEALEAAEPSHAGIGIVAPARQQQQQQWFIAEHGQYPEPAGPSERPSANSQRPLPRYGINKHNIGYQLLRRAGWKEGTGLGAQEQGPKEPLQPTAQPGQLGLGYALRPQPTAKRREGAAADQQQQQEKQQAQQQRPARPLPEDPLEKEPLDVKVKRVRQVCVLDVSGIECDAT